MKAALAQAASIAVTVFAVSSMLSVGLAYRIRLILGPLREPRALFRALVANFVLVPLLAVGIERVFPLDPPLALGLFLLAGAALDSAEKCRVTATERQPKDGGFLPGACWPSGRRAHNPKEDT